MHLMMFDIDGTLLHTNEFDDQVYVQAMRERLGVAIDTDWTHYQHVTDSGIADELFAKHKRPTAEIEIVKQRFVSLIKNAIANDTHCCQPIRGANDFVIQLQKLPNVAVGIATGGWSESARAKLQHSGIDLTEITFASCDDAMSRIEIMEICARRAASQHQLERFESVTYFGDGIWDANAAATLGWNFIGVGGGQAERLRATGARYVSEDYSPANVANIARTLGITL